MTRIGTTAAALLSLALLSSACGGGSGGAKDAAPTKGKATAAATAIGLTKADLGAGFESSPADNSNSSDDKKFLADAATCLGVDPKTLANQDDIVDLKSDDFNKGQPPSGASVSSEVEVVPSESAAKKQLATFHDDKTLGCLKSAVDKSFKDEVQKSAAGVKLTFGTLEVSRLSPSADGTDGSFGFRIKLPIMAAGLSIPVQVDILAFLVKHTEVSLTVTSFGPGYPDSDRDHLYGTLVERAKKSAV